ncbi:sigma-54 interaction domain-containing protein [Metabacillus arenae]|uniref:Sigma 54-interacting transcriptional regulator n=1 Tax=Metabacillus arenae TaxID=2771434 RepID=A0A926S207_9BACI|nr:sigma 54-interacting transcriptional regulator [Metabacillus arenae]MBD1381514.1 sigma 54-interacting transcriptional regulator [Metabacillus arenae]
MRDFPLERESIQQIFSNLRDGVLVVDLDLHIIYINESTKAIGLRTETDIGKSLFTVFPNLKKEYSSIVKVLSTGKPIINQSLSFITYRGERKTTLTSTYPMYKDGVLVGVFEVFQDISAIEELSKKMVKLQKKHQSSSPIQESQSSSVFSEETILGQSEEIQEIKQKIPILAKTKSPIFIYGETGTGKELIVQAIHAASTNQKAPFVAQNCAAIPEALLEGILFGTTKGGFTGAEDRPGLFELAHTGTLFLDEINSMPASLQAKLLRVIQEGKVRRIGGQKEFSIQVRIVAATNIHPEVIVQSGELRSDLYYRLNVIYLEVPTLRNRKEDIPELVNYYVDHYNKEFQKSIVGVDIETMNFFMNYEWPGNIRELRNLIERAMNLGVEASIHLKDIEPHTLLSFHQKAPVSFQTHENQKLRDAIRNLEIKMVKEALEQSAGNVSKAARQLDIPQQTLNNKIKKFGLRSFIYQIKMNTQ